MQTSWGGGTALSCSAPSSTGGTSVWCLMLWSVPAEAAAWCQLKAGPLHAACAGRLPGLELLAESADFKYCCLAIVLLHLHAHPLPLSIHKEAGMVRSEYSSMAWKLCSSVVPGVGFLQQPSQLVAGTVRPNLNILKLGLLCPICGAAPALLHLAVQCPCYLWSCLAKCTHADAAAQWLSSSCGSLPSACTTCRQPPGCLNHHGMACQHLTLTSAALHCRTSTCGS